MSSQEITFVTVCYICDISIETKTSSTMEKQMAKLQQQSSELREEHRKMQSLMDDNFIYSPQQMHMISSVVLFMFSLWYLECIYFSIVFGQEYVSWIIGVWIGIFYGLFIITIAFYNDDSDSDSDGSLESGPPLSLPSESEWDDSD